MKILKYTFLLFLLSSPFFLNAQAGITAVPFVLIGPSPQSGGNAGANSVLPTNDAFGFYYNPAQLGHFSAENNFAVHFYPQRQTWLPQFNFSDLYFQSTAIVLGYQFPETLKEYNFSIGFGYQKALLNLGENIAVNNDGVEYARFDSKEYYHAFSVGLHFEYFAKIDFGFTYKSITSKLAPKIINIGTETTNGTASASAIDFGFIVTVPILKSHIEDVESALYITDNVSPYLNFHTGIAYANIGNKIKYIENQSDPLPKEFRGGIGFSSGITQSINSTGLNLLNFELGRQVNDLLIKRPGPHKDYENWPSDVKFFEHLIEGKSNDWVTVHTTLRVDFMEFFGIGWHSFEGGGFNRLVKNESMYISSKGLLKFIFENSDDSGLEFWLKNIDIRYSQTTIKDRHNHEISPLHGTKYKGISISISGIQDLIL